MRTINFQDNISAMTYSLVELNAFSKSIVYTFSPESSEERLLRNSQKIKDALYFESMQYVDILNAYLYAQNSILPQIKLNGLKNILPEQWLEFIKTIHTHMGKTILSRAVEIEGSSWATCRWHAGYTITSEITAFLNSKNPPAVTVFAEQLHVKYKHPVSDIIEFIKILRKLPRVSQRIDLSSGLFVAYHNNSFSAEELIVISEFVKVSSRPEEIAPKMQDYAERLFTCLQTLDSTDDNALSEFLASTFYGLTDIHPFKNGNGRTATCLINTLLVGLGYPSILIRLPNERQNVTSRYSIIMKLIDKNIIPFVNLIKERIRDARTKPPYEDKDLQDLIEQRVLISQAYAEMWKISPAFDADEFQAKMIEQFEPHFFKYLAENMFMEVLMNQMDESKLSVTKTIMALKYAREQLNILQAKLNENLALSCLSITKIVFTKEQQQEIMTHLAQLTGEEQGWKAYEKGATILFSSQDQRKVDEICAKLNALGICLASSNIVRNQKKSEPTTFVAKITDIKLQILLRCQETQTKIPQQSMMTNSI